MKRSLFLISLSLSLAGALPAQSRANPAAQREAMRKLAFLAGAWTGEASVVLGAGEKKLLRQSETVEYRLNGLVLLIEGAGRLPETGAVEFNALATISYDERSGKFRIRAYNEGNYLDTELIVRDRGFEWGFTAGPATVRNVMSLDDAGQWVEYTEIAVNGQPPRRTLEMRVRK